MSGTAPDGGLYVPEHLPQIDLARFSGDESLAQFAAVVLQPFFAGSSLAGELDAICSEAFNFPAPIRSIAAAPESLAVLELFHGPTAAFKDFGARFLAACMARIIRQRDDHATILVATSGDTGGAVASAFHRRPGTRVVVLFPEGRVSPRQQHQLTCWGDNILSLAVKGEFDDCQRLVKEMFANRELTAKHKLCSANSINVGRLLPQSIYYAKSSLDHLRGHGQKSSYIVPTGNLGNAFACAWAKQLGFPVDDLVLATNANRGIPDYLATGRWEPRSSIATLASAMDVGNPSNLERLRALWGDADELRLKVRAFSVTDAQIREQIREEFRNTSIAWCPHTATGFYVYRHKLLPSERSARHWVIAATAHAAKFDEIVEPLVGEKIAMPAELAKLLRWPAHFSTIDPDVSQLVAKMGE
jgi:threonine synthase